MIAAPTTAPMAMMFQGNTPPNMPRATEAISQILGPFAQLMQGSPTAIEKGVFAHNILGAYQSTINHGSVQVMRDQVARIGLGLPRSAK